MRYIIYGAGAVGGTVGALLARSGHDVVLIARGEHGAEVADNGLRLRSPEGTFLQRIPTVHHITELAVERDDLVILAVKTQDVQDAVASLPRGAAVVCVQNGVVAEELTDKYASHVYACMTWIPAVHLEPGVVDVYAWSPAGVFIVGGYPTGTDARVEKFARDLCAAGFDALAVDSAMAWKRGKLLTNLGNVMDAYLELGGEWMTLFERCAAEGDAVLRRANLDYVSRTQLMAAMRIRLGDMASIDGAARPGGSTWQSVTRGLATETRYLNGWLCELGASLGVATPVNRALLQLPGLANGPRSVPFTTLEALVEVS